MPPTRAGELTGEDRARTSRTGMRVASPGGVRWWTVSVVVVAAIGAAGCAGRVEQPWPPREDFHEPGSVKDVWIVRHGWHTRVAVRRADVDLAIWPESRDIGDVRYLEAGWGDRDYYPNPAPSIWDAIDAVVRPTAAALHVGGFDRPPPEFLADNPVIRLPVSQEGFDRLTRFISTHYVHGPDGDPLRIRPGYYPRSWFYEATGAYHVFNNSNHWAAMALAAAGVPVRPSWAVSASCLMRQANQLRQQVRPGSPAGKGARHGHAPPAHVPPT